MDITTQDFRQTMGRWATGVAIATTRHDGQNIGITINSFTSVSLEPPLVSFCLGRLGLAFPYFAAAPGFAINILGADQEGLVAAFAARGQDASRWSGIKTKAGINDNPLLTDCIAWLDCRREAIFEAGDHAILVGRAMALSHNSSAPLLRHSGKFGIFQGKS